MNWYWYYIFGEVMSNVMQYFLKVIIKALLFPNTLAAKGSINYQVGFSTSCFSS